LRFLQPQGASRGPTEGFLKKIEKQLLAVILDLPAKHTGIDPKIVFNCPQMFEVIKFRWKKSEKVRTRERHLPGLRGIFSSGFILNIKPFSC